MRLINFLFKGLKGKLTLTYTLVTVLALLALEAILFISTTAYSVMTDTDEYMDDVITTLVPEARSYLQPEPDLDGLQVWLTTLSRKRYASLEPQGVFDSPAAAIVPNSPIYVLSLNGDILAQNEFAEGVEFIPYSKLVMEKAYAGSENIRDLYMVDGNGKNWIVVPIYQTNHTYPVLGIIVLTVEPLPTKNLTYWSSLFGFSMLAGALLLAALAPFGTIFGFVISKGLTKRLTNLSTAAQFWGKGDFSVMPPPDRGNDEISALGVQMREMARRISILMEDQQSLAQIQERNHIAQELHDTVKQQNFATLMQVRAARNTLIKDPSQAEKSLIEAEKLIKDSQQELGLLISELRPPALEGKTLTDALEEYTGTWSKNACIPCTFTSKGERPLSLEIERTLYRIVQEGLSNTARHSRASACSLTLNYEQEQVKLEIKDNGVGFDLSLYKVSGFGLTSMQERLKELDGRLLIQTGRENGTILTATLPITKPLSKRSVING